MEQLELAQLLGRKSASSVSEWERGTYTPKAGVLSDIARIFNVSLSDLMNKDLTDEAVSEEGERTWLNFVLIATTNYSIKTYPKKM